jgi:sporulation protein YlmC with PRC-barrel domain
MRTIPIVAAAVLAVTSGMAFAQTTPARPGSPAPSATTAPAKPAPVPNPLKQDDVSQIDGSTVYGTDNDSLGKVSRVLMNPESKQIDRLVISSGGVVGIGAHRVAIPIDKFTWDSDKGGFKLPMTAANVKSMPEWAEGGQTATGSSSAPKSTAAPSSAGNSGAKKD